MKIHMTINEPVFLTDAFGKKINGPMKSLGPFETFDAAIKWLEFLKSKNKEDSKELINVLQTSSRTQTC